MSLSRFLPSFRSALLVGFLAAILPLSSQNQPAALAEAERSFRDQVLGDPTLFDKRLFMRRYELVLKLLKKERWADASRELAEMRDDFSGRSAAFLDYLRARLEVRRGDDLNTHAGSPWEWVVTNLSFRGDQRYLWFPERRPAAESNLLVERRSMPFPQEAYPHYALAGELYGRLSNSAFPALREAAALGQGDLAWSVGERERAGDLWSNFSRRFPASTLRLDAWLRLSRHAAERGAWGEAVAWIRELQREFPKSPNAGIAEEKSRLLLSFSNAAPSAEIPPAELGKLLETYRRELSLKNDLTLVLDQLAARGLAEP